MSAPIPVIKLDRDYFKWRPVLRLDVKEPPRNTQFSPEFVAAIIRQAM